MLSRLFNISRTLEQAGEVCYADVDHKGGGIVHFGNKDDMEYALRKLDGSEFSNRYDAATIQVRIACCALALNRLPAERKVGRVGVLTHPYMRNVQRKLQTAT